MDPRRCYIAVMRQWRLIVLLVGELAVLLAMLNVGDLRGHVPLFIWLFVAAAALYVAAALTAMQLRLSFVSVLVIALQLRIPMFFTEPTLSDDVWRYLHDGRAQAAGINPYAYAPDDPRTVQYRGPEFARINHPQLPTIYPPVAQFAFRLAVATPDPLLAWRLLILAAELTILIAGALLLKRHGLPPANLALYAWHPLAIVEGIGSAHLEPIGIAFLVVTAFFVTRGFPGRTGASLAASVAAKLVAAPLLIFSTRNTRTLLFFIAVLSAVYLPFILDGSNAFGSFRIFSETWESNGSVFALIAPMIGGRQYRLLAAAVIIGLLGLLKWKQNQFVDAALAFFLTLFLLSPVVHPWYLLWLVPFLAMRARPFDLIGCTALAWTITVVLAYSAQEQLLATGVWKITERMLLAEYAPVYLLLIIAATARPFSQMKLAPITRKNAAKM